GNVGIGVAPSTNVGLLLNGGSITASGGGAAALQVFSSMTIVAAANNDAMYGSYIGPSYNAASKTGVTAYGTYIAGPVPTNWGQATTSGYGARITAPTGAAVD